MLLAEQVKGFDKVKQEAGNFDHLIKEAELSVKRYKEIKKSKASARDEAGKARQGKAGYSKDKALLRLSNSHYLNHCIKKATNHIRRFTLANTGKEPLHENVQDAIFSTIEYILEKIQNDSYVETYPVDVQIASKAKFAYVNLYKKSTRVESIEQLKSKDNLHFEVYESEEIEYSQTLDAQMKRHTNTDSLTNWQAEVELFRDIGEYAKTFEERVILANIAYNITYVEIADLLGIEGEDVKSRENIVKNKVRTIKSRYTEKLAKRRIFINIKKRYSNENIGKLYTVRRIKSLTR